MELRNFFAVAQTVLPKTGLVQQPVQIVASHDLTLFPLTIQEPQGVDKASRRVRWAGTGALSANISLVCGGDSESSVFFSS
jgi:hypothetical protein